MAATPIGITQDTLITTITGLYTALQAGLNLDLTLPAGLENMDWIGDPPEFSQYPVRDIPTLTLASLTEGENTICGEGAFDVIMKAVNKHLDVQLKKGNISQSEAAKLYISAMEMAMGQAVSYLVSSNESAWNGEKYRREAELLEIQKAIVAQEFKTKVLETVIAKMGMGKTQVDAYKAVGELVATKVAIGDTFYNIQQKDLQSELVIEQIDAARAQTKNVMRSVGAAPGVAFGGILQHKIVEARHQAALVSANVDIATAQTQENLYSASAPTAVAGSIFLDNELKRVQKLLLLEQVDAAKGQTKDVLIGTTPVLGILGAQRDLYRQQIDSYILDGKNKAAKLSSDAFTTIKTIDEAATVPGAFQAIGLNNVLTQYFADADLPV